MRTRPLGVSAFLVAWVAPAVALAQQNGTNCPPGSWFCEESGSPAASSTPPPALPPPAATPPPPPTASSSVSNSATANTTVVVPGTQAASPPVVIYQQAPPPPPVYVVRRPVTPVVPPPPPPVTRARLRRWGLNLRLEGVMMDGAKDRPDVSGMAGAGISFRARPLHHFALDFGLDALGGRDYRGNTRSEYPFTINAMAYVNPRNPVQFYLLGGIGWSSAHVEYDMTAAPGAYTVESPTRTQNYSYFGGQLGAGLEFRLSPPIALNVDLIGFVRGRTDSDARRNPEFIDETGRSTNTSGGGLFRGGLTFYW